MTALKLIVLALGIAFTLFGYLIYFRKKYSLINGFDAAFKAGRKSEAYAKRLGLVELFIGAVLLIMAAILALIGGR